MYYSYGQHGYSLNRVAQSMYYNGVDVDLNDLQAGDILLFGSSVYNIWHAALYIGGGNFIHAPLLRRRREHSVSQQHRRHASRRGRRIV